MFKPELCSATLNVKHTHIAGLFLISQKFVNFPSKLQNRFSNVSCFPLFMQIQLGNDAHALSHIHTHIHTLPESTLKLGLLEVCVWDCVLSLVMKWSAHANRPIMYILSWHSAILKLEHCISAVVF